MRIKRKNELNITLRNRTKQVIAVLTNPTLKLQIRIDFKWNRKVVLAVKSSSSSCQIRNIQ